MSNGNLPREFVCVNPECRMQKEKFIQVLYKPLYEKVYCGECGHLLFSKPFSGEIITFGREQYETNKTSSGYLPILPNLTIDDQDVEKYPNLSMVRSNPNVVNPDLLNVLQSAMIILVSDDGIPKSVILFRIPRHYLVSNIDFSTKIGIHIEVHEVDGYDLFGIYPILWDNPQNPFFMETWIIPYNMLRVPDVELCNPIYYNYQWRKLFYLLTQSHIEFILIDESNNIVFTKLLEYTLEQRKHYLDLARRLDKYKDLEFSSLGSLSQFLQSYQKIVDINDVRKRFHTASGLYMGNCSL